MAKGTEADPIFFKGQAEYRAWLVKNHNKATELWIGFWRKSTAKPSLTWQECVDQSLCFGWIDGIRKTVDAHSYKQRVTPRRSTSIWSTINIRRVGELTAEGRMRPMGLAAFEKRDETKAYSFENRTRAVLGAAEEGKLRRNKKAWATWESSPPGYRRVASWYVMSAKKEETRQRRLASLIRDTAAGRKLGLQNPKKP